jgi:hypothetical protein
MNVLSNIFTNIRNCPKRTTNAEFASVGERLQAFVNVTILSKNVTQSI